MIMWYDVEWMIWNWWDYFSVWDVIIFFKDWAEDFETTIVSIDNNILTISDDFSVWDDTYWIKALVANFTLVPTDNLNWSTIIDLDTLFWSATSDLYYRITLSTTDVVKTPTVNIIEMLK